MFTFSVPRLPFREDKLFGVLVLAVFAIPLIFFTGTYEKFETVKTALFLALAGAAFLVWAARPRPLPVAYPKVFWLLIAFLLAAFVLSSIFSQEPLNSLTGSYMRFTNGLVFFLAWLGLLLFFLPMAISPARRLFFFKVLFLDAVLIAVVGLLQSVGVGYYEGLDMPAFTRAPSLLGNPNFSSMFMAACAIFSVPLFLNAKNLSAKVYYAAGAAAICWAVVILSSRGGWLGLGLAVFAGLGLALLFRFPKKIIFGVLVLGMVGATLGGLFYRLTPRQDIIASTISLKDTNVDTRLSVWQLSAEAVLARPLLGTGPGNFILAYEHNRTPALASEGIFDDPHNLFIQQAVTLGLPFVLLFLCFLLLVFWNGLAKLRQQRDPLVLVSLSGLFALLMMACFNPFTSANYLLLAFFLSVLAVKNQPDQVEGLAEQYVEYPGLGKYLIGILGAILVAAGVLFFAGEVFYYQGLKAFSNQDFRTASGLFRWADRLNPRQEMSRVYLAAASVRLGEAPIRIQANIKAVAEFHPQRAAAYAVESNLYYYWYYYDRQQQHLDDAVLSLEQAVGMDPYYARRYGRLGFYYLLKLDAARGEKNMKQELVLEPGYLPGWLLLAKAYQVEGKKAETLQALKKAFDLRPDLAPLKILLKTAEEVPDIRQLNIPGGVPPDILE